MVKRFSEYTVKPRFKKHTKCKDYKGKIPGFVRMKATHKMTEHCIHSDNCLHYEKGVCMRKWYMKPNRKLMKLKIKPKIKPYQYNELDPIEKIAKEFTEAIMDKFSKENTARSANNKLDPKNPPRGGTGLTTLNPKQYRKDLSRYTIKEISNMEPDDIYSKIPKESFGICLKCKEKHTIDPIGICKNCNSSIKKRNLELWKD